MRLSALTPELNTEIKAYETSQVTAEFDPMLATSSAVQPNSLRA